MSELPYTHQVITDRLRTLNNFGTALETIAPRNADDFRDLLVAGFTYLGFSTRLMADDLGISHSAIERWLAGRTTPHQSMWPSTINWMRGQVVDKTAALEIEQRIALVTE